MNFINKTLARAAATTLVAIGISLFALAPTVKAIPWTPTATGLNHPGFNIFTGVPDVGDESDFMRGRVSGSSNAFTDPVNDVCTTGTQYSVQMYVHNGANQSLNNNGTGQAVAHGTTVKVGVPATTATNITGTISANNASSVNDTLTINCNGVAKQLSFVQNSALEQHMDGSTSPLSNNIVTTGAPIDSRGVSGDVWGCFEERVIVYLKVEVKDTPPPVSEGACKLVDVQPGDNRSVTATVSGTVNNATIVGYEINWGDGSAVSNKQTDSHTYAKDGTYKIVTKVNVKFADGHTEWKTAVACTKEVTFESGKPPVIPPTVTPPTTLVKTGPGSVAAVFTAFSLAGATAYRVFMARRLSRQ
jgi:hypothetical protein